MYTKLFRSITSSSVWIEDSDTIKLWVFLLAEADQKGYVFGSVVTIADRCKIALDKTSAILHRFSQPDPHSSDLKRNPENEGRRIEVVDGGWRVINLEYYRDLQDSDVRRSQIREAVKRHRERKGAVQSPVIRCNHGNHPKSSVIPSEADTDAEADTEADTHTAGVRAPDREFDPEAVARVLEHYRATWPPRVRCDLTSFRQELIAQRLREFTEAEVCRAISNSKRDRWPRRHLHCSLEKHILADREQCEKWLNFDPGPDDGADRPKLSPHDVAVLRANTFTEWQASVRRAREAVKRASFPDKGAYELAVLRHASAQGYRWEMDPPPSGEDPGGLPWKAFR